ncbi:hypothetical protein [Natribacillus halophilus]|uniref:Flagellar protein FliT n=1 Tax=Natribacillus halophilus TaxID=549003 RepID=A0A1G8KN60_9BACI|nr:hypothetical protein [Natribacillus halophilus]SDI44874.1 flagellar protein FliT [Natribacillus halophilus]
MAGLAVLYKVTKELSDHLQQPLPPDEQAREDYLDIIDFLLEKRALLLATFKSPSATDETLSRATEIAGMNEQIEEKLQKVKARIGRDLKQARRHVRVETQYASTYVLPATEGFYVDKKH